MSRIGNKPVPLPKGVKVHIGEQLLVEGPKGKLSVPLPGGIEARQEDSTLVFARSQERFAALHGLTRALAANAVQGVSTGFTRDLDIVGIGYRADIKGIDVKIDKQTHLVISGADRQRVGQVAANMRALRPPEPYKNKGVRYTGEALRKKVGKTGAGAK
jgi:large subunit ribosomal protein L6